MRKQTEEYETWWQSKDTVCFDMAAEQWLIEACHFEKQHMKSLENLLKETAEKIVAETNFMIVRPEDYKKFKLSEKEQWILVTVTLGDIVDKTEDEQSKCGNLLGAYALDCLSMYWLQKIYETLPDKIQEACGLWPGKYEFPGDSSLFLLKEMLAYIPQSKIRCNQACAMLPKKSVVFTAPLLKEKNNAACKICSNCGNKSCQMYQDSAINYGEASIAIFN